MTKPSIPMPTIVSSAAAVIAAFTVLIDGEPTTASLNDANHLMLVFAAGLLALGGASVFFQSMIDQADGNDEISKNLGEKMIGAIHKMARWCSLPIPWILVGIGTMLCYRVSPAASGVFFTLICGVVIWFGFMSGKLRFAWPVKMRKSI